MINLTYRQKFYLFFQNDRFLIFFQDGSKVFTASCDKTAKMWDLNSNQAIQIAQVINTVYRKAGAWACDDF